MQRFWHSAFFPGFSAAEEQDEVTHSLQWKRSTEEFGLCSPSRQIRGRTSSHFKQLWKAQANNALPAFTQIIKSETAHSFENHSQQKKYMGQAFITFSHIWCFSDGMEAGRKTKPSTGPTTQHKASLTKASENWTSFCIQEPWAEKWFGTKAAPPNMSPPEISTDMKRGALISTTQL